MTKEKQNVENSTKDGFRVYEVSYLINPSYSAEALAQAVSAFQDLIKKEEGEVVSQGEPKLINLAYTMIHKIGGKNIRVKEAFFGWIKFEMSPASLDIVKKAFDANKDVIRSLIITTVRENTLAPEELYKEKEVKEVVNEENKEIKKEEEVKENKEEIK